MMLLIFGIAAGCIVVERLWPAMELPRVRAWWPRVVLVNAIQLAITVSVGVGWNRLAPEYSLVELREYLGTWSSALIAYFISTFIYYWWHRLRHDSAVFWRLCHQLHHSPRRLEIVTSFYKHPVEIFLNALLSSTIVYALLGCTPEAGAVYTLLTAVAEFFYHWNIRTPYWLGFVVQRPESHRVHHQYQHHTNNFADLPIWDWLFGTLRNPRSLTGGRCGFDASREERFEDMLACRDVHAALTEKLAPLHLLPTCIGCSKRWACSAAKEAA